MSKSRWKKAEQAAGLSGEDVQGVATNVFKQTLTEEQIIKVLEAYPDEQESDPGGSWELVMEHIIDGLIRE